jgi:ferredoxin
MPLETFKTRMAENVPGKFYVGNQCLDCDLCRAMAPDNFDRNHDGGYSFVKKQPETPEELALCREAMQGCCTETIHDDGDRFDWAAMPAPTPWYLTSEGQAKRKLWVEQARKRNCCGSDHGPDSNGQR